MKSLKQTIFNFSTLTKTQKRSFSMKEAGKPKFFGPLPSFVKIVEVGPRDGLQNEKTLISTDDKVKLIDMLADCGIKTVEACSFVSPKWIPQAHDSTQIMQRIKKVPGVSFPALVPNMKGFLQAKESGCEEIAIFVSASESFSKRNINCTIDESFVRLQDVVNEAKKIPNMKIRGYVSCVMGCPYEGLIPLSQVTKVSKRLIDMGCYEVSLGDTIGVGTPGQAYELITTVKQEVPVEKIALHTHATYGQALASILTALQLGVTVIDSSVAGLGGCPYAKGASGNVPTEDLVYMLNGLGIETGVDLDKLNIVGSFISKLVGRPNQSKVGIATEGKGSLPKGYDRVRV